jgi:hypothetical protein
VTARIGFPVARAYELAPAGTHLGVLYSVIEHGTQTTTWGEDAVRRTEIRLVFEIPDEMMADGRPFTTARIYTLSAHPRAGLRLAIEGMLGRALQESELRDFDIAALIGTVAVLSIRHQTSGTGRQYAAITSLSPAPKGVDRRRPTINPPLVLSLRPGAFDAVVFNSLPRWERELIEKTPEYAMVAKGGGISDEALSARLQLMLESKVSAKQTQEQAGDLEDEIPF